MAASPPAPALGIASPVLALSKAAWRLGISLSRLDRDTGVVDHMIKSLAEEIKSLGNQCDLVYAELEEVTGKAGTDSLPPYDLDGRMWNHLNLQANEASRTMRDLERFFQTVREAHFSPTFESQRQNKPEGAMSQITSFKTRVCRHTDNLHTALLVVKTLVLLLLESRQS